MPGNVVQWTGLSTRQWMGSSIHQAVSTSRQKQPSLSVHFDHEIMEIGIICSNLIGKRHSFCIPWQNAGVYASG
jgi:hypothetical protein